MDYRIFPPEEILETTVSLPPSKSMAVRAAVMAALAGDAAASARFGDACTDARVAADAMAALNRGDADITVGADDLYSLLILKRLSDALMARIHRNYRFIVGFNLMLILLGVGGIIQPTTSALLHNMSTLGISLKSMTDLLPEKAEEE